MPKLVRQSVTLQAPAKGLYAMYLNPRTHKAITGGKVVISARSGSKFSAFDGMLRGRTLYTVPGRLIVQAWRSSGWKKGDLDWNSRVRLDFPLSIAPNRGHDKWASPFP